VAQKVSDEQFIECFKRLKQPSKVSEELGISVRAVYTRRNTLQAKHGITLETADLHHVVNTYLPDNRRVAQHEVLNGNVFIASDCHYWPDEETVAHKAFVKLAKELQPEVLCLNGDVFDGAQVSRHPPLMGVQTPTPKQEIEACQDRLHEISMAARKAKLYWTFGNHDVRLFNRLASQAPELVDMVNLWDNFPGWRTCWRLDLNEDTIVKHRWHNGIHATYNNTLKAGKTLITGHLHKLQCVGYSDWRGRRWGVDTGTLAEPYGDQFVYTEMNPVNWASGFAVLTFRDGKLLPPELCEVLDGVAYFRGKPV
jgi:predicted phosphodiesterase